MRFEPYLYTVEQLSGLPTQWQSKADFATRNIHNIKTNHKNVRKYMVNKRNNKLTEVPCGKITHQIGASNQPKETDLRDVKNPNLTSEINFKYNIAS